MKEADTLAGPPGPLVRRPPGGRRARAHRRQQEYAPACPVPNRRPKPKAYSEDLLWRVVALMCAHAARAAAHAPKALLPRSWYYGYAQREAAELLCMHVNTVARVMQRFPPGRSRPAGQQAWLRDPPRRRVARRPWRVRGELRAQRGEPAVCRAAE